MRIMLIHPPPWQIPTPGKEQHLEFPPSASASREQIKDLDFLSVPYGLLSLAAQALRAGHRVEVVNMSGFLWETIEDVIRNNPADVYGMTCMTMNRRGMVAIAKYAKECHPQAHVTVGGPHVTALPEEMLSHYPFIDSVVIGEGEVTFMELLEKLEAGKNISGIAGMACRDEESISIGPERERISDLDSLALPQEYYPIEAVMTSRGCPGKCTFCASATIWKRKLKFHSVERVLDMFDFAVNRHGLKGLAVKDDTFTASKKRALAICRGIRERGLNFMWSCDTRVDYLDEELIREMRLAGCQRISVGVESANPEILKNICKRITPEQVLKVTRLARKYGMVIRYYMIAGCRGETVETYKETCDFIEKARPNSSVFCILTALPGTEDWRLLELGGMSNEIFFEQDFAQFEYFAGDLEAWEPVWSDVCGNQMRTHWEFSSADRRRPLLHLPGHAASLMDLAIAFFKEGKIQDSIHAMEQGMNAGYPIPAFGLNLAACILARLGDTHGALEKLHEAQKYGYYAVVEGNLLILKKFMDNGMKGNPELDSGSGFEITMRREQPILPTTEIFHPQA